jgi:hypothetical protein
MKVDIWNRLNGVLYKSLPSVYVSVSVSLLSLLGNGSVKCIPPMANGLLNWFMRQRINLAIEELFETCVSVYTPIIAK